jgi:transposase-like protein
VRRRLRRDRPGAGNTHNGYHHRDFDTPAGTVDEAIPKLRSGSYFPEWLLERGHRAERALTTVVATCYLLGVSTRRMEKLVESMGITRRSKSQVSVMAAELDAQVADFRDRPCTPFWPPASTPESMPMATRKSSARRSSGPKTAGWRGSSEF